MELDHDGSEGCIPISSANNIVGRPVVYGESGEGSPFAPEDWPNPGDKWKWRVGKRKSASGFFVDRYLYLPDRLQNSPGGKRSKFASKSAVVEYIQKEFPNADINAFFSSFVWKIPFSDSTGLRLIKELSMVSQHEGIGSSVDSPRKKKYGKSIRWTPELSHRFIEYVAEEVRKGNTKNNNLEKVGWKTVKERFLNELGISVTKEQLRNHFDKTRRLWQGWQYLNAQIGLGWDETRQTYTASDSFWEGFKKMYKDGYNLRWKGLDNEEEQLLQTIYGGSVTTSEDRRNPSTWTVPPNEDAQDLDPVEELGNNDESTPTMKQMPPPADLQSGHRPRASRPSSSCQPPTRRRRTSESCTSDVVITRACDLMEERAKVIKPVMALESHEQAEQASYKECMQLLEELPTFDPLDAMYTWAPSFLLEKGKRLMFISMSNIQLREGWLRREYEKSVDKSA